MPQDAVTGLNLESFLHLLRADLGAWSTLALIAFLLALMAWTSWGSRRALRKCLVLSIVAHFGLVLYGGTIPVVRLSLRPEAQEKRERLRQVRVSRPNPGDGEDSRGTDPKSAGARPSAGEIAPWDKSLGASTRPDPKLDTPKAERVVIADTPARPSDRPPLLDESAAPEAQTPSTPEPESRPVAEHEDAPPLAPPAGGADEVAPAVVTTLPRVGGEAGPSRATDVRIRPGRGSALPPVLGATGPRRIPVPPMVAEAPAFTGTLSEPTVPRVGSESVVRPDPVGSTVAGDPEATAEAVKTPVAAMPRASAPEPDLRRRSRPDRVADTADPLPPSTRRPPGANDALTLNRVTPGGAFALPEIHGTTGGRPLTDVPEVYRTRLDPNRSALAFRAGASPASEQAVERALDWLARHQDTDGRWDAATAKGDDGTPIKGDDDYTVHCPAGETCFGECAYWEADTALTGLSLLAYLGAGYTHTDGKYAPTVAKGVDYLLAVQKADGDLRGRSRAVGMYCHAMASIALCEAYALTGDEKLRRPVERAIDFLVRSRARDGLAWRYSPGATVGDTSILGWVVMAMKSAKEVGIAVPSEIPAGAIGWLDKVADGPSRGLARYQPGEGVNPTMTAEAWVCRQFLGVGGPGASSREAAALLLKSPSDRGTHNYYYWYYGTLSMYQYGGDPWARWNGKVRDEIVRRQRAAGHIAGSWDPDDSAYGRMGGRVYCTALATLSLEVYYRYLRLYDEPKIPPAIAPSRTRTLGRSGGDLPSPR